MATRKSDNSSGARWRLCLTVLALTASAQIPPVAPTRAPQTVRVAHSPGAPTANEAGQAIDDLVRALGQCRDEDAARYMRYRLGIAQFKAGRMAEAVVVFEPLAHEPQAPELLRICSLNMAGQIARLQGEHAKALQAFADLAGLAEKWPTLDPQDRSRRALHMLWRAALISRAEIQESRKNLAAAAAEYERVLQGEEDRPLGTADDNEAALVTDRLSQLCLQMQDTGKYLNLTADLIARFPAYPRIPIVELERVCVQALQGVPFARECPPGVLYAPARFVAHLRRSSVAGPAEAALNSIERLCRKYEGTPGALRLDYDYAWMLDAAGRRDQAIEALARIATPGEPNETVAPEVIASQEEVLRRYAVLQHALLLAEGQDYNEALKVLAGLPPAPDKSSHVSRLTESMIRNVQILKREVSRNVPHGEK